MHEISVRRIIKAPCDKIRSTLWEIKSWAQFWSPIHQVDILYDDGWHQDFTLFLEWQATDTYIRTVRFLDDTGNITFFSPHPPAPLLLHQGLWQLTPVTQDSTELIAIRSFELPCRQNETIQEFSKGFIERLENLLRCLGELCEK